jgi:hypothetical protein
MPAPRLEVDGVGVVALPLLPLQAEQLVAVAERAPYGRGADTLLDTDVRRTWQIGPDRVRIGGKHWAQTLQAIVARAGEGLGVSEPIEAELYKLLVYDTGSFFVSHRDTEKAPGMFATLVVVLPSVSTGGELVVRHKGCEVRLDLRSDEPSEAAFAAFYADCVHEVLPVASGCRLTLVYNLSRTGKGPQPEPPSYEGEQGRVVALLRDWAAGKRSPDDEEMPEKLIYPLEHAYTQAELAFDKLKGADAAAASVLVAAAPLAGCDLHLALLSIEESGIAEQTGDYPSRRGRWSDDDDEDDDFEEVEVTDRREHVSEWRRPDGSPSTLGQLPIKVGEICPPDALEDMEPDEQHFHEATGNAGASFDRTYRRAALVLWPGARILAVLNQAGLPVTLPYLEDLTERWIAGGEGPQSALWHQAHELSGHMVASWPARGWYPSDDGKPTEAARMLAVLTRLGDTERIDAFVANVMSGGQRPKGDNAAVLGALRLLAPERAAALLARFVAGTAATSLAACGDLLARAVASFPGGPPALRDAAAALVEALPGDPARAPPRELWWRDRGVQPGFVVDCFNALARVDKSVANRAADHMLAWPKTYGLDTVLIPAVRQLAETPLIDRSTAVQRLRDACVAHLRARAAEPLEAPRDWRRSSTVGCPCGHCGELSRFLADPARSTWTFKAAEFDRSHVEGTVRNAGCDLDLKTDRHGRPYSLVCTKNQASYDRRAKQRKEDLSDLQLFDG